MDMADIELLCLIHKEFMKILADPEQREELISRVAAEKGWSRESIEKAAEREKRECRVMSEIREAAQKKSEQLKVSGRDREYSDATGKMHCPRGHRSGRYRRILASIKLLIDIIDCHNQILRQIGAEEDQD